MRKLLDSFRMFRFKSVFIKWLLFFNLFVMLAISIFGYFSYTRSASLLLDEVIQANNNYMEQTMGNIDKTILSLNNLAMQISLQPYVKRALYLSEHTWDQDQMLFYNIIDYLSSIKVSNDLLTDVWIQFYRYPVVLTDTAKYNNSYYYEELYQPGKEMDWQTPLLHYYGLSDHGMYQRGKQSVLTFAMTAPISEEVPRGSIYFNVATDDFAHSMQTVSDTYPAFIYVLDKQGEVLFTSLSPTVQAEESRDVMEMAYETIQAQAQTAGQWQETTENDTYQIVYLTSAINEWTYISVIPRAMIMEKVNDIGRFTLIIAICCLGAGLITSYFLMHRLYEPIARVVMYLQLFARRAPGPGRGNGVDYREDELGYIDRIINYVYAENKELRDSFERHLPKLQQKFLYDLIDGGVAVSEFAEVTHRLGMTFPHDGWQVIVFETVDVSWDDLEGTGALDIASRIDRLAEQMGAGKWQVRSLPKRNDKIVTVINLDSHSPYPEQVYDFIRNVQHTLGEARRVSFTVGVGRAQTALTGIPMSYVEALSALRFKIVRGQGSIIFVEETAGVSNELSIYPLEQEKKIMNALKTGSQPLVLELLQQLWQANRDGLERSPEGIALFSHALAATVSRTLYDIGASSEEIFGEAFSLYRELEQCPTLVDKRELIEQTMCRIADWVKIKQQGQHRQLSEKIKQYVALNYHSDLSLGVLGENLGLSPTYLSSIFKEMTGMNFVDYINSRRIEQALEQLKNSQRTVAEIALAVGFTNVNTFIRAFKRQEGITPGQFRQTHARRPS